MKTNKEQSKEYKQGAEDGIRYILEFLTNSFKDNLEDETIKIYWDWTGKEPRITFPQMIKLLKDLCSHTDAFVLDLDNQKKMREFLDTFPEYEF